MILAAVTTGEGAIIGTLVLGGGALLTFLGKLQKQQDRIVKAATDAAVAQVNAQANPTATRLEQPLRVHAEVDLVARPDFHKHAEINRSEHARLEQAFNSAILRIETKTEENVRRIEHSVTAQGREISEIKAQRDENGKRLGEISEQLNGVATTVNELNGVVHEMNRRAKS